MLLYLVAKATELFGFGLVGVDYWIQTEFLLVRVTNLFFYSQLLRIGKRNPQVTLHNDTLSNWSGFLTKQHAIATVRTNHQRILFQCFENKGAIGIHCFQWSLAPRRNPWTTVHNSVGQDT